METIHFDDTVIIECLKNGQKVEASVHSFKENEFLSVVVQKSAKINMQYNESKGLYIGRQIGLEFVTEGPQKFVSKIGR